MIKSAVDDQLAEQENQTSLSKWKPFPTEALPNSCDIFVRESAKAIGCDESFLALPLLAGLASAIGNTRVIRLKNAWAEPAVLWAAIVGESGTQKSPALESPLKAIKKRQEDEMEKFKRAKAKYKDDLENFRTKLQEWKKQPPDSRGEAPSEPKPPICERFWCSDITVECIADRLQSAPRGLLLDREELSGWLRSFGQYKGGGGGDESHWLAMHGARSMLVDRKTGDKKTIYVRRAAVCITGSIQPLTLANDLGRKHFNNGLAARFLLAYPPRKAELWTDADISEKSQKNLSAIFNRLYSMQPQALFDGKTQPQDVHLSPEAKIKWIEFFNRHKQELIQTKGDEAAALAKLEGGAARLALVIHCTRWASGAEVDQLVCDEQSMIAGITMAEWFKYEALRVYAEIEEQEQKQKLDNKAVNFIQRNGGWTTVRKFQQGRREIKTAKQARNVLTGLEKAGLGSMNGNEFVLEAKQVTVY